MAHEPVGHFFVFRFACRQKERAQAYGLGSWDGMIGGEKNEFGLRYLGRASASDHAGDQTDHSENQKHGQ